ncbi:Tubulointerstitial nephritis antigen-like [Branchiostoma belcheri]|nr:Tubulointerstitial nephritis antigen-like [Branchiostoma belcheri]
MSRRRGRRRNRRSRRVTFPRCPPSDTHADQKGGRLRFLKAAAITVLILVAVTSIAGVVMTAQSLSNTGEDKLAVNLPPYGSKGDDQAGSGDSEGLSPYLYSGWTSGWIGVQVKPRDFVENDAEIHNGPDGMVSTDAPLTPDAKAPVDMTPSADHTENARVSDNQTETFRSEGWKRFRVEQNHTEGVNSTTKVPTVPPHVVGDEEGEVAHDWGYTTGGNHFNNARVRRRVSKVPVGMTPPAGHAENAQVPDNQKETFRSEGWKRFRVEQNHTEGANSTTEVPTVPPHVVGDEEGEEVGHDWGYTTGESHCNNVRVTVDMTPPTDRAENAQVPDKQTETFRSEDWKRFRVEQNHTEDVDSTTEAPTAPPNTGDEEEEVTHDWGYTTGDNHCNNARVPVGMTPPTEGVDSTTETPTVPPNAGDEEEEVGHDWGYTTGDNHCNNVRVRRRVSKVDVPRHDTETYPAKDGSSSASTTNLEPKPNSSLDKKSSGDVDSKGATAMDTVHAKNSTDLNLYLDAVLTDIMKSRKRKQHRVLKRIKRSKAIVVLAAVGVLIAGSVGHIFLRQIVP